jgi:hypothetical protein
MKAQGTDIDIDLADREKLLRLIKHVPAMQTDSKGRKVKHNTGVYFHDVPVDPYNGLCTLDYKKAEELGYFKIDLLNVGIYQGVKDPDHLDRLANAEPDWNLLTYSEIVEQLAMVLAVIRPGKRHLVGRPWSEIETQVWEKNDTDEGYSFKRSHALGYALAIIVQLNLLKEQALGLC